MKNPSCFIKAITQKNKQVFSIEWTDGLTKDYCLSDLQKKCPCAGCADAFKVSKAPDNKSVDFDDNLSAKRIYSVGRYALRIEFTSGCSSGLYDYEMLRNL